MNQIQKLIIQKAVEIAVVLAKKYALIGIQKFADMIFERLERAEYEDKPEKLVGQRKAGEFKKLLRREYRDRTKLPPPTGWAEDILERTWRRKGGKALPASIMRQDLDRKRLDRNLDRPIAWGPRTGKAK